MKVTEFTYCNPDSDGDIRLEGTAVIENKVIEKWVLLLEWNV